MRNRIVVVLGVLLWVGGVSSLAAPWLPGAKKATPLSEQDIFDTKSFVKTVAVTGATGRTGRLVVQQLLDRGVDKVVAIVRDSKKGEEILGETQALSPDKLQIVQCDLTKPAQIAEVLDGVDAAIWCATGFSDSPSVDPFEKVKRLLGIALTPKQSIDSIALPAIAEALAQNKKPKVNGASSTPKLPTMVVCSSAGVTRPTWDEAKAKEFVGAADIPIVRLNPFGILDVKRESEERLRQTCVENDVAYCIVRPAGLNDKWPAGSRPIFSQGDVAAGRINRQDVAKVLVDALTTPEATGKTFEVVALAGYPPPLSMRVALSRLRTDEEGGVPSPEEVAATYHVMQQLLPGEKQDAAGLAFGQTYEELDKNKTGRLGERGRERVVGVAPLPTR